jgi:hypothetical protein
MSLTSPVTKGKTYHGKNYVCETQPYKIQSLGLDFKHLLSALTVIQIGGHSGGLDRKAIQIYLTY